MRWHVPAHCPHLPVVPPQIILQPLDINCLNMHEAIKHSNTLVHQINQGPAFTSVAWPTAYVLLAPKSARVSLAWGQGVSGNVSPSYMACSEPSQVEESEVLNQAYSF